MNFQQIEHALAPLDNRRRSMGRTYEAEVDVRIYRTVVLYGSISVRISHEGRNLILEDHKVTVLDKDGKNCDVDWDDLWPDAQEAIDDQVKESYRSFGEAA